jgi:hypothetical protein
LFSSSHAENIAPLTVRHSPALFVRNQLRQNRVFRACDRKADGGFAWNFWLRSQDESNWMHDPP